MHLCITKGGSSRGETVNMWKGHLSLWLNYEMKVRPLICKIKQQTHKLSLRARIATFQWVKKLTTEWITTLSWFFMFWNQLGRHSSHIYCVALHVNPAEFCSIPLLFTQCSLHFCKLTSVIWTIYHALHHINWATKPNDLFTCWQLLLC